MPGEEERADETTSGAASEFGSVREVNSVFEVLANERRRLVLYYLLRSEGQATVEELAGFVAERAPETSSAG